MAINYSEDLARVSSRIIAKLCAESLARRVITVIADYCYEYGIVRAILNTDESFEL